MSATITEAVDELIQNGGKILAGYSEIGNIDQHDLWFQAARSFLAVNDPELEQRLLSVAPKYRDSLLSEPNGRAAYMLIQEQLEVVKLARYRLVGMGEVTASSPKSSPTWVNVVDEATEVKPGLFGVTVDLKKLFKDLWSRKRP